MKKLKELFKYGIGGILTTVINYIVYFGLGLVGVDYLLANTLAWMVAVVFSYGINRKVVFASNGSWVREFISFVAMRFLTLCVENLLLFMAVDQLKLDEFISKIAVSVVTVLANYVICQRHIFKKTSGGTIENG